MSASGLRPATGVTAFIDVVGAHYIDLALNLGVPMGRIDTVVDYQAAAEKGVKALGTRDAGGLHAFADLAGQAAAGELVIPIGATYSLSDVKDAYTALAECRLRSRTILRSEVVA